MDVWNRWFYNTRLVAAGRFVMERGNTKQEILEASLELFSVQGFEATSISQIANAVGVRKASLYSHFGSKQAILDALVQEVLEQYEGNMTPSFSAEESTHRALPVYLS